jgi:hypothetical protein
MLTALKGKDKQLTSQCFCKEKANTKIYKNIGLGGGGAVGSRICAFRGEEILEINPREKRVMSVQCVCHTAIS